jgi:hypothetical protein
VTLDVLQRGADNFRSLPPPVPQPRDRWEHLLHLEPEVPVAEPPRPKRKLSLQQRVEQSGLRLYGEAG